MKNTFTFVLLASTAFIAGSACAEPEPVKLSSLDRSIFFRDGKGTRGKAGFNGGDYSDLVFDGNFSNYAYQNTAGAELVIPTTDAGTGEAWYVTEFKVGHAGNTKYSLYYTTEAEPSGILSNAKDPRSWKQIPDATGIQAAGTKAYSVGLVVTAVKYVFDTAINWNQSLGEVEVWGVNPAELGCMHAHTTEWEGVPGTANCTEFGIEQRQCTDCGEWFQRASSTVLPLGHAYEAVLTERGTSLAYGSGTNVCRRCGHEVAFPEPRDLAGMGGIAAAGIVQFTDISVSSTGNLDWGVNPGNLIDGNWGRNFQPITFWYAATVAVSEYVQFAFNATIDLAWIELSTPNRESPYKLQFYSVEGGIETLVGEQAVEYDSEGGDYQRLTIEFRGVSLSALRIKSNDASNKLEFGELHPYGTVAGAGKSAAVRTRVIID